MRSTKPFPPVEYDNWPLCGRLLPHALAVAPWIERDRMEFAEAGRLLNQTAFYLYERGQYAEAEPLYKQAMEIRRTALGEGHPDYATSLNNLAGCTTRWAGTPRPSRSTSRRWRFVARPWASGIPTTPPR